MTSRQGFTDFPGQQPQLSPTGLCMNYKGEVPEKTCQFKRSMQHHLINHFFL
jgi:hypothetical protein